jgi:FADH2 O2-dependent halogenase
MRDAAGTLRALRRLELSEIYDIAVVGSGFAGSLLAMIARRLGRSVILIEKGTHPRVVIGESSTPLSNLLLEELTTRYGFN